MYGGGEYGGSSQFAGGGFMPSPQGAGAGTSPGAKPGGGQKNESLSPMTVKQLHEALQGAPIDDSIRVDGEELHSLTLVGKVVNCTNSATLQVYTIDDGTGTCEVRHWLDDDSDLGVAKEPISCGVYVRVYGHLRAFQGQRNVVAFTIRPIQDFNEITYHLLETIFVHLRKTKYQSGGSAQPTTPIGAKTTSNTSSYHTPQPVSTGGGDAGNLSGQDLCVEEVKKLYEEPQALTDVGMNVSVVEQRLGTNFTAAQIREAVETLVGEGHLYSTIDDVHFRATTD